ncbi:major facilitator superfamily domain-containing protein 9-like [Diorhabda carinulata]|uniref:major facilitator superfamily domain-containing protein 9-like n=1 Tax=Diorhabda carinulata TaxID=1163345 RepID=UPI0025A01D45|nr:major facilitator superfamily domain-containing protein 9-like [Diorhabda carinulata]
MGAIKTVNLIYAISFLDLFAVGLTFPLVGNYLRDIGASHTTVGLISSTYSAVQVLSGPFIGGWSDVRNRKSVLKFTIVICALCYALLGITRSIIFITAVRCVLGLFKHTQSICKAVITDLVPLKEQNEFFARSAAVASFGFIIGPFVGGHISEFENGFTYVCLFTGMLFIINYGCACYLPDDRKTTKPGDVSWKMVTNEFKKSIKEIKDIDWKVHWDTFLLKFLLGLTITVYFSNQAIYLKETFHLSQKHIGYMISFFSTVGVISGLFLKKIDNFLNTDIYSKMSLWFGVLALCFISLYLSPNIFIFMFFLIPLSVAASAMRVTSMELMFQKIEALHRGSFSGASNSVMSIARFMTPLFTGLTSDIFNEKSVMLIAVVPACLGVFVSIFTKTKYKANVKNK